MINKQLTTFAGIASGLCLPLTAATISWGASAPIDDAGAFVNTTGTLVAAINADNGGDNSTIGGINFLGNGGMAWNAGIAGAGGVTISSNTTNGNFGTTFVQGGGPPPGITDPAINNLIGSAIWNPQTVTMTGLTVGDTYIIQVIGNDSRNGRHDDFVTIFSDGVNGTAGSLTAGTAGFNSLSSTPAPGANPAAAGHSIIGTFVASSTTQTFDIAGSTNGGASANSGGRAQINGFQLRTIPVPEPSTAILSSLAGMVLLLRRRK